MIKNLWILIGKKRKNPELIKIKEIISELCRLKMYFMRLWILYWKGINISGWLFFKYKSWGNKL